MIKYRVWQLGQRPEDSEHVVEAHNSFEARKLFAAKHKLDFLGLCANREDLINQKVETGS